jgi:hypothetical protein
MAGIYDRRRWCWVAAGGRRLIIGSSPPRPPSASGCSTDDLRPRLIARDRRLSMSPKMSADAAEVGHTQAGKQ